MTFDRVLKFGGAGLADGPAVLRACKIVADKGGERPIVVVSAHQGVTDLLDTVTRSALEGHHEADRVRIRHRTLLRQLGLDPDLLDRYFTELFGLLAEVRVRKRLLEGQHDHLLSFGERMSARIVAHTLKGMGMHATPIDAWDLGITTDSNYGDARPLPGGTSDIRGALEQVTGIPVVTGFLAKDSRGNLTTMGRNGSDLTAAIIAEAVGAGELQLWKAVGGMMTADPEIVPDARVVERLGFQEAQEYAFHGAEVLYGPALAPVQRAGVTVRILNVNDPEAPGTVLETTTRGDGPVGIAARSDVYRLDLAIGPADHRGPRVAELFTVLARHRVEPSVVSTTGERVSVMVAPCSGLDAAVADLGRKVKVERDLAVVALIGRSIGSDASLANRCAELLSDSGVECIESFSGTRQPSLVFVVRQTHVERAVRALHEGLLRAPLSLRG
ncbi:MAG: aspartate kinase [Planctomycetota bacterium]|nr:aspartate kinase [Planctomycetota bacterium]